MSIPASIDTSLSVSTTKRKLGYIRPLQDFMQLKGKFMRYRMDPTYADVTPNYYEEIQEFIELYTDVPGHGYWDRLDSEQKLKFCKFLRFSDDMPTQFNILCDIHQAKIVIVLNDSAHVTTHTSKSLGPAQIESTEEKGVFGQGQCFGGHKKFNEAYQQLVKKEEEAKNSNAKNVRLRAKEAARKEAELQEMSEKGETPVEEMPDTVAAYMQKGTFLQITVKDYLEHVLGIEPKKKEAELEDETDEEIARKALGDMTQDDFKMVAVKRQAKRKLAETMFNFMSKFELIPHNADIVSSEFVSKGNLNRRIDVAKDMYYVVISGIICLEAKKINPNNRSKGVKGHLSLSRVDPKVSEGVDRGEGMTSVGLSRPEMKVLRLYPGTILALDNPSFEVGTALDPRYAPVLFPGAGPRGGEETRGLASVSQDSQDSQEPDQSASNKKLPAIHHLSPDQIQELERERRRAQAQFDRDSVPAYKLQMLFESPCTFLSIPKRLFRSSLKDLPADAAADIMLQLHTSHELAYNRIARLGPWIRGDEAEGQTLQLDLDDGCYNEEVSYRTQEALKSAPFAGSEGDLLDAGYTEPTPEEIVKEITLSLAAPSVSPKKKGGQSKFQLERREMAVSKSTGSLPNTRGILKVGNATIHNGRGRNKESYDILKQSMTLKEPLDGTYGEAHTKLMQKRMELPPVTPVTALVREQLASKSRSAAGEEDDEEQLK